MSWRLIPICCVFFAFIAQIVYIGFSKTEQMYLYLEKTLMFAWFLWMVLAFYYDKDIPIPGDFAFKTNNPEQQTGRADSKLKCNTRSNYEEPAPCQSTIQSLV
jgi:hypothetical protein